MGFFMDILQFFNGIMCVYLRGSKAAVAQQFLNGIQVSPAVHQMGGKGMPEHMGAFFVDGGYQAQVFFYRIIYIPGIELFPCWGYQQECFIIFLKKKRTWRPYTLSAAEPVVCSRV